NTQRPIGKNHPVEIWQGATGPSRTGIRRAANARSNCAPYSGTADCFSRIARVVYPQANRSSRDSNPHLMGLHCVSVRLQSEEAGKSWLSGFQHSGKTPLLLPARG